MTHPVVEEPVVVTSAEEEPVVVTPPAEEEPVVVTPPAEEEPVIVTPPAEEEPELGTVAGNICTDEELDFERSLLKELKSKNLLAYPLNPISEKPEKKSHFLRDKKDDPVVEKFNKRYRALWYCRNRTKEQKANEVKENFQTTGGDHFDYVSFSIELEHAVFMAKFPVYRKEFYRYFFIPNWSKISDLLENFNDDTVKRVYEQIQSDRKEWQMKLAKNPNKIPFAQEDFKVEHYDNIEIINGDKKAVKPDARTKSDKGDGRKFMTTEDFFQMLPLGMDSIYWGDVHSAVGTRIEWTLVPSGKMDFPRNVDFFYKTQLKKIEELFSGRAFIEHHTEIKDFNRLQMHVVFKLKNKAQIRKLLKIANIWNTEKYFRLLTAGATHTKPWKAKDKKDDPYDGVFHIPWSEGLSELALNHPDQHMEKKLSSDASLFKFHHVGVRRKYRDEKTPSTLPQKCP